MTTKPRLPFYSFNKLYSYNAVYNFCVGGRGLGKSYGMKKKVISDFIKHRKQFILLRRYREELTANKQTFFADIQVEFPTAQFRVNGNTAQMLVLSPQEFYKNGKPKKRVEQWEDMGFFVALSNAQARKGTSYAGVHTIIFDEFIIEKGLIHYLPDEHIALMNFYSTVDRYRDRVRVYLLANAVTMSNPYFDEYEIRPDQCGEWSTYHDGFIVVHFPDSKEFGDEVYKTRFGRFIKDSEYAKYAVGNSFHDAHSQLILKKGPKASYWLTLELPALIVSVWRDTDEGVYFVQSKRPKNENVYTMVQENMSEGKKFLAPNDRIAQFLRSKFNQGGVFFDEPRSRNAFIKVVRK